MSSSKTKKFILGIMAALGFFASGILMFPTKSTISALADENVVPDYFSVYTTEESTSGTKEVKKYNNGETILLTSGQYVRIRLGNGLSYDKTGGHAADATFTQNEKEFYPIDLSYSNISLYHDGESLNLSEIGADNSIKSIVYRYGQDDAYTTFDYFEYLFNVSENTPAGKYTVTFTNYLELSGTDYAFSTTKSFEFEFYVFNKTDYLTASNDARITASGVKVETLASDTRTYNRNYFFHYANEDSSGDTATLTLPKLTFNATRFSVGIKKVFQASIKNAIVFFDGEKAVIEGDQIVSAKYIESNKQIEIVFNDLGEYTLTYSFIYTKDGATPKSSSELDVLTNYITDTVKPNKLDIFGYQNFYHDVNLSAQKEFKTITNGTTSSSSDITFKSSDFLNAEGNFDITKVNPTIIAPVKTNQAPISFKYNVEKKASKLHKWNGTAWNEVDWDNSPLADKGIYFLEITYTYPNYIESGRNENSITHTQYFYFEITDEIPSPIVEAVDKSGARTALSTNSFTKNTVEVSVARESEFNSPVRLEVMGRAYNSVNYTKFSPDENGKYTLTENMNYRVVLYYGAKYNLDTAKSRISYFTIDNQDISGLGFKSVTKNEDSSFVKRNVINFFTNQNAVFEWSEKASGAKTTASFKYIPFKSANVTDNPNANSGFNAESTKSFFENNNALRTGYTLNYTNGTLADTTYTNTNGNLIVSDTSVLSREGLYIFKVVDEAGNEAYSYFVLENFTPIILQKINGTYEPIRPYNVISSDAEIQWGRYKLIETGITSAFDRTAIDSWLQTLLDSKLSDNTKDIQIMNDGQIYLSPEISGRAYMLAGNNFQELSGIYRKEIFFLSEENDTANETSYTFYIMDESSEYFQSQNEDFINNASGSLNVEISSDASGANLIIERDSTKLSFVGSTDSYSPVLADEKFTPSSTIDTRIKYYMASGYNNASDIMTFLYIFNPKPNENIEIEDIKLYYFPFETKGTNLALSDTCTEIEIYKKGDSLDSFIALSGDLAGMYGYKINTGVISSKELTLAGKYVIVRTYTESTKNYLSNASDNSKYDFPIRKNVFIVDRENIVSAPTSIDNQFLSVVGQNIVVKMGTDANQVTFNEIYKSSTDKDTPILTTNILPIKVVVPNYKFGALDQSGRFSYFNDLSLFFTKMGSGIGNTYYYGDFSPIKNGKIDTSSQAYLARVNFGGQSANIEDLNFSATNFGNKSFDLSVEIKKYNETTHTFDTLLNMFTSENGLSLSSDIVEAGRYQVVISQNASLPTYPNVNRSLSYIFEVVNVPPEFKFTSDTNEDLNVVDGVSYTNSQIVRVTWTDSSSPYMAKIDKTKIYFGGRIVDVSEIKTLATNTYYFEKSISNIVDGGEVYVQMQYEGTKISGMDKYFSIERKLIVDRNAPTENIAALINRSSLAGSSILENARQYVDINQNRKAWGYAKENIGTSTDYRYNSSASTGSLAYFGFPVKQSEFSSLYPENAANGYKYYFKQFDKDKKYNNNEYWQETSISNAMNAVASHQIVTSSTAANLENLYYEIIEIDPAGNIAVYTIYVITDSVLENTLNSQIVLSGTKIDPNGKSLNEEDKAISITYGSLKDGKQTLYLKESFIPNYISLYNFEHGKTLAEAAKGYFQFKLTQGTLSKYYLASPYLAENTFYDLSTWNASSQSASIVSLENILKTETNQGYILKNISIQDMLDGNTMEIDLYVSSQELSYSLLQTGEGITISAPSYMALTHLTLDVRQSSGAYTTLLEYDGLNLNSNEHVTVQGGKNNFTFSVVSPVNSTYRYSFVDNFGKEYVVKHTYGSVVITNPIRGHIAEITDAGDHKTWYYGNNDIRFSYDHTNYTANVSISSLELNEGKFTFGIPTEEAIGGSKGAYTVRTNANERIVTFKIPQDLAHEKFAGGAVMIIINLTDTESGALVETYNLLINTLTPNVRLLDKNGNSKDSLYDTSAIFSGEITLKFDKLTNYFADNVDDVTKNLFPASKVTITFGSGTEEEISSGKIVSQIGTYAVKVYSEINGEHLLSQKSFNISDSQSDFYRLVYFDEQTGNYLPATETGKPYVNGLTSISTHYIVNSSYDIYVNDEQEIKKTETGQEIVEFGTTTKFYLISNYDSTDPNINYFQKTIAVTYVPKNNSIINNFSYYNANGLESQFENISSSVISTVDEQDFDALTILWDNYYLIKENTISIEIKYGENAESDYDVANVQVFDTKSSITLKRSGRYTISFKDLAGNKHVFTHSTFGYESSSYSLMFIKDVVFEVNSESPIDNAIYNGDVVISLPESTKNYYDTGYAPSIKAFKNGAEYEISRRDNKYTFTEPGFYEVGFTAKIGGKEVREETTTFTIINANETRWAFEFSEFDNYQITKVLKDNENLFTEPQTSLLVSLYDEKTGSGRYHVEIATNGDIANQTFAFDFWINDAVVPIEISVPEGTSTTDKIIVTYNPYNIYNNVGDCKLVIGNREIAINSENMSESVATQEITAAGTYFIQILTESGRMVYSYKVVKNEPLNTIAIILIVVGCVVVAGVIVAVVLLRKRMKIR